MKRTVSVILCILFCLSVTPVGFASYDKENNEFVFRNGITWGMSQEDVKSREETPNDDEDSLPVAGITSLFFENIRVGDLTAKDMAYCFFRDKLYMTGYVFWLSNSPVSRVAQKKVIKSALESVYGDFSIPSEDAKWELTDIVNALGDSLEPSDLSETAVKTLPDGTVVAYTVFSDNAYIFYYNIDIPMELDKYSSTEGY